jgi:hypothetical protein
LRADAAFSCDSSGLPSGESKLNSTLERKKLFDEFMEQFPHARKYVASTSFGKRMKHYYRYKGLRFNPNKTQ